MSILSVLRVVITPHSRPSAPLRQSMVSTPPVSQDTARTRSASRSTALEPARRGPSATRGASPSEVGVCVGVLRSVLCLRADLLVSIPLQVRRPSPPCSTCPTSSRGTPFMGITQELMQVGRRVALCPQLCRHFMFCMSPLLDFGPR